MQEESFEVQYTQEGERLDKVLSEIYPDFSRSFFQKLIKDKQIQKLSSKYWTYSNKHKRLILKNNKEA